MQWMFVILASIWTCNNAFIIGRNCQGKQSVSSYLHHIGANYHIPGAYGVGGARDSIEVVEDPYHSDCYVLKVNYAAGSHSKTDDRAKGAQFYVTPNGYPNGADDVTISYDVMFDRHFKCIQGGKLPGMWGHNTKCSGGSRADTNHCISTRFMWRDDTTTGSGNHCDGELYLYFPMSAQASNWVSNQERSGLMIDTHGDYGVSFRTSSFVFRPSHWTNLKQQVHLNSVSSSGHVSSDGWIAVWFDGSSRPIFNVTNVILRKYSYIHVDGLYFSTFFGGHEPDWATKDGTFTLYKNFVMTVN